MPSARLFHVEQFSILLRLFPSAFANVGVCMNFRHLVIAYCLTWGVQLSYLSLILMGWRRLRK